jgi:hypothetical protein
MNKESSALSTKTYWSIFENPNIPSGKVMMSFSDTAMLPKRDVSIIMGSSLLGKSFYWENLL